jgi:predicted aspartyl protease
MRFFNGVITACLLAAIGSAPMDLPASAQELNTQQVDEATRFFKTLAAQSKNPLIAGLARENLVKLQNKPSSHSRQITVQLLEQPDASLVAPTLLNDKIMGTFLVDTGASYTMITPQTARKLGIEITAETPKTPIITGSYPAKHLHRVSPHP